jgi:hypothetical protein
MNGISHKQAYKFIHMGERQLNADQAEELASHLVSCPKCQEYVSVQRQLAGLIEHAMHCHWDGYHYKESNLEIMVTVASKSIHFRNALSFTRTLLLVTILIAILVAGIYFLFPGNTFQQSKTNEIPAKSDTNDLPIIDFPAVSPSPTQSKENALQKFAVDMALAYFTFDYRDVNSWWSSVQDQTYWEEFIKKEVSPVLIPFLEENRVISKATLVSSEKIFYKKWESGGEEIIWKLDLTVNPPWPGEKPPYPFGQGASNIPWTNEEETVVYSAAIIFDGNTEIILIPADNIDEVLRSL